jgi:trehalose 6-phosphate synthase
MAITFSKIRNGHSGERRLVVVSNRVPTFDKPRSAEKAKTQRVGGLVSALHPVLQKRGGLWFGWSGKATPQREMAAPLMRRLGSIDLVTIDLSEDEVNDFYTEFSNRTLWPLFHGFPNYVKLSSDTYQTYRHINHRFATTLFPMLRNGDLVWVHDYHLIPLGTELRRLGWTGNLGFFLHIPFPQVDILTALPWAKAILKNLMAYDLLGFHTQQYCLNCVEAMKTEMGGIFDGHTYSCESSSVSVGVYPIGTDPDAFKRWASSPEAIRYGKQLRQIVRGRCIVLGVDRLDYTKGITERLRAFERLLEHYPSWHGYVSMIQITAPSRTHVPEYIAKKREVDQLVTKINGSFSNRDWTPVHHLYRSYSQEVLSAFYREADVCFVTPLCDGMNLVAKEYIASQTGDPGVLILSRFCGAAEGLQEAIIINPYDIDGTAEALKQALEMPLGKRRLCWQSLIRHVHTQTAQTWSNQFLADLAQTNFEVQQKIPVGRNQVGFGVGHAQ